MRYGKPCCAVQEREVTVERDICAGLSGLQGILCTSLAIDTIDMLICGMFKIRRVSLHI